MPALPLRPPLPPFTAQTAVAKVRAAEDAWNSRDPERVVLAYTPESRWRNRSEWLTGHAQIIEFLRRKWSTELEYRLIKELWAFGDNRIAVRFAYESRNREGQWTRAYGNENWAFDADGRMAERHASINDVLIDDSQRLFLWTGERRPDDHPGLSDLGL